jgi:hypothetical protein
LVGVVTSADQPSDSLVEALNKARIPSDNHAFIRRITTGLGITDFRTVERADKPYVVAKRDDGRDLHIYYGYTVGFTSEGELVDVLGSGAQPKPSSSPKGTWWVEHPVNKVYDGSERSRDRRREAGFCQCGIQLSLTGECGHCG